MGNKSKNRRPKTQRPVNPNQHELIITRRLMENAIIERARAVELLRQAQEANAQMQLVVAALLRNVSNGVITISDSFLDQLQDEVAGINVLRDDAAENVTISLVLREDEEE